MDFRIWSIITREIESEKEMKRVVVILLVLICLFAGCAQYYYQEGTSYDQGTQDLEECYGQLSKYAPEVKDVMYEQRFMEDCMKHKGYGLVKEDKLPLRVKREHVDWRDFAWHIHGLAGTVEE